MMIAVSDDLLGHTDADDDTDTPMNGEKPSLLEIESLISFLGSAPRTKSKESCDHPLLLHHSVLYDYPNKLRNEDSFMKYPCSHEERSIPKQNCVHCLSVDTHVVRVSVVVVDGR